MAAYWQITSCAKKKSVPLSQVTDEGLPAPKQGSLRRTDHRGIQANYMSPKIFAPLRQVQGAEQYISLSNNQKSKHSRIYTLPTNN